jgi:hypothetical protein
MAILRHQGVWFVVQLKAEQGTFVIWPSAQQSGLKTAGAVLGVNAHVKPCANGRFFADFHVGHHAVIGQHALDQQFNFAAR